MRFLVESKPNLNIHNKYLEKHLIRANENNIFSFQILVYLIQNNCNLNSRELAGYSILHFACNAKNISLRYVKFLVKANCFVNVEDKNGNTPIHFAVMNQTISKDIIKYLIKKIKFDLNIKNKGGYSPLPFFVKIFSFL